MVYLPASGLNSLPVPCPPNGFMKFGLGDNLRNYSLATHQCIYLLLQEVYNIIYHSAVIIENAFTFMIING